MHVTVDELRRSELASFLRIRRARISPDQVGLPVGRHRRALGLRREEVSQLAGIGPTWYAWLEQGRNIKASGPVLESIARVLQLDPEETSYLLALAGHPLPRNSVQISDLTTVERLIEQQGMNPAFVHNARLDMLASNRAMQLAFPGYGPWGKFNLLRAVFTRRVNPPVLLNWEAHAQRMIALYRTNWAQNLEDPAFTDLIEELSDASPEFRLWWARQDVGRGPITRVEVQHPRVGRLMLVRTSFELSAHPDLTLVLYTPAPETDSAHKLAQLYQTSVPQEPVAHQD
jgi:transcriptional regulator with XRE-family HTH domain